MTVAEAGGFARGQLTSYVEARVTSGEHRDEAERVAEQQMTLLFPGGRPAPGHVVFAVVDADGADVGAIWIGPRTPDHPEHFWVWDVSIDEPYRGQGLGRSAMVLAEAEARARGATQLGLNVFGSNVVARGLYESLGYETSSLVMRKAL
jgi:ribosomal protein S18 acetylase RimI-like enzyme